MDWFRDVEVKNSLIDPLPIVTDILNGKYKLAFICSSKLYMYSTKVYLLKIFLEIQVEKNGRPLAFNFKGIKKLSNYRIIQEHQHFLEDKQLVENHFGRYPVIFLSFVECCNSNRSGIISDLKYIIHKCYKDHEYLKHSRKLTRASRKSVETWCEYPDVEVSDQDIKDSLKNLSLLLYQHFSQKTFVLVDDCNSLIVDALFREEDQAFRVAVEVSREILSGLMLEENHLVGGFLTGSSLLVSPLEELRNIRKMIFVEEREIEMGDVDFQCFRKSK